ncbi:AMP-binding protein [Streptomyces cyaneofuscatus]|uniref:AMP-binding protein n=1 Tax=Streptomyces cyaneofuscatus TaxID=66883 RepID=A0ABZ1EW00_9ACTN|nr:AMP-binding protein [Streptomyces cyaneofuscatus]WSB08282.1 AMP-binding protein [Streptomyces cyaneofuscatus]WSD48185.1 AMP-binding protein [Streptomyces cyaneofuscatus]WTA91558.1 AMP-binding protein [Streptomyces cyaneofuscatus]
MTAHTAIPHMLSWLEAPPPEHSLRFSDGHGAWSTHSYPEMARQVRRNAFRLRRAGVGRGDVILLLGRNTIGFVTSLYGILHAGATPAIVAPLGPEEMEGRLRKVIAAARPAALLAAADHAPLLESVVRPLGCRVLVEAEDGPMDDGGSELPETALIQFSSGSTGNPRGVRIPWSALNTHLFGIHDWLSFDRNSRAVSWLPFYHDLGLVGCLLMPLALGASSSYMTPQEFIGHPLRWLREISRSGETASAIAAFSLPHLLRRVRPEHMAGLDLSRLRSLVIGAERIDPDALSAFHRLLAPAGLAHGSLLPAYGMAEATLGVTGLRPDAREIHSQLVDMGALEVGKPVPLSAVQDPSTSRLVSSGRPLVGMGADILDADGELLPEGMFGEIAVSGYSLATGYLDGGAAPFGDRFRTGDMGFKIDNELYVVGRAGDSAKVNGRPLFAEDVQALAIAAAPRPQRVVALLGDLRGVSTAVVVMKGSAAADATAVGKAVAAGLPGLRVMALLAPSGAMRPTTSGKPRRKLMWQELMMSGAWESQVVWDSQDPDIGWSADRPAAGL